MSILSSIKYRMNTPTVKFKQSGVGALSSLDKNPYELATYRYPLEGLGDTDAPHYMLFNINLPTASKYVQDNLEVSPTETVSASTQDFDYRVQQGLATNNPAIGTPFTVGALKGIPAAVRTSSSGPLGFLGPVVKGAEQGTIAAIGSTVVKDNIKIAPQLMRIATSIALYMPDTQLTAQYEHDWGTRSLTEDLGLTGIASAFQGDITALLKNPVETLKHTWNGTLFSKGVMAGGQGAEAAAYIAHNTGATNDISAIMLRSRNRAINPQVQMIFRGTANREFQFEFDLQPRSMKERDSIHDIINTFKRFAAPEIAAHEGQGRYFIPPAQFDIKFFFKDKENQFIGRISTCVLTNVTVDYNRSPPFASFDDGNPVHIQLQLRFKEVDVLTRELLEKFNY